MIYLILNFNTFINVFITFITQSRSSLFTFWHTRIPRPALDLEITTHGDVITYQTTATAMVELMVRSCCLLSYVDYFDIWLYVPTLHKVVFKLSNQHYQQDYLVLINPLDRFLFLLEVTSLELFWILPTFAKFWLNFKVRFWMFVDLIHSRILIRRYFWMIISLFF